MALVLHRSARNQTKSTVDDYDANHALVELRLTPSSGLGLIAKKNIKRGTRILSEAPLLAVSGRREDVQAFLIQLEKLHPSQLSTFDSLCHNTHFAEEGLAKAVRNALLASGKFQQCPSALEGFVKAGVKRLLIHKSNAGKMSSATQVGVFPLYSRVNHSCSPNAHANYNPTLQRHTVHAIRDIQEGEEIVGSYIDCTQPIGQRNEQLLEVHRVDCYCIACKKSATSQASERRRRDLTTLLNGLAAYEGKLDHKKRIDTSSMPHNPKEALSTAESAVTILKELHLTGMYLAKAYRHCSKFSLQVGMVEKAKAYGQKELEVERYCLGTETSYMREPSNAETWLKNVQFMAEKEQVKIRMCEKRNKKEVKKADKKAAKKEGKGGR